MLKKVVIAKILTSHGVKGNVKLESYMDNPKDIFKYSNELYDSVGKKFAIKFVGTLKPNVFMASIDGINDMDTAKSFRNTELFVDMDLLPQIKDSETFYFNQLIGLNAKSINLNKNGIVSNVYDFGAGTIIEIKWEDEKIEETLPFNNDFIKEINIEKGYMVVESPKYF